MPFSAASVANEFLRLAHRDNKPITPLKMQKLVYFAHGWYLALTGLPLLSEPIQAWEFGPVIPTIYKEFKELGSSEIHYPASVYVQGKGYLPALLENEGTAAEVSKARQVIERVWDQYGHFTAAQLTTLTHNENSPWSRVPNKEEPGTVIPNDMIREYFLRQAKAS
jgi:uncharacterized phage-associated protein